MDVSAAPNQSTPLTERAALTDLVTWAEKRPAWQRDALRRLVAGETLDDQVIAELTELCLDPRAPIRRFRNRISSPKPAPQSRFHLSR